MKRTKMNKTNRKTNNKNKSNKNKSNRKTKTKIGGLGTFFPRPPKNKEEEIKTLTNDIGRVKLQRIEKSLKLEFDNLKQLRKNCMSSCKIESCMYKNKENCHKLGKLIKNKNKNDKGNSIERYCAEQFDNLTCRNYASSYDKMKFYLNYIDTVNKNCKKQMEDYNNSFVEKENNI